MRRPDRARTLSRMIGKRLGKDGFIEITDRLGRGGMGAVFRAVDHKRGGHLAVKFLVETATADPDAVQRFVREGKRFAGIRHPNVARVFGLGREEGQLYVVSELIEGDSLRQRMRAEPQPDVSTVLRWSREIASGVHAAHEAGIVHRDLKPDNVMVRAADDSVAVLDFGIAKDLHGQTVLTAPGAWIGTPGYAAPEQVAGETVDARTDIFALGVMLYEMLTGQVAFEGQHTVDVLRATLRERPKAARKVNRDLSGPIDRLLGRMMHKKPRKRIDSMATVVDELERLEADG